MLNGTFIKECYIYKGTDRPGDKQLKMFHGRLLTAFDFKDSLDTVYMIYIYRTIKNKIVIQAVVYEKNDKNFLKYDYKVLTRLNDLLTNKNDLTGNAIIEFDSFKIEIPTIHIVSEITEFTNEDIYLDI